ncbi:MAG: OsmC family protein [Acidobacteriales bacterium]|nr:OsmC family protein [Terriglobales bacterium]
MSDVVSSFSISTEQVGAYEFRVKFDKDHYPDLTMDEPAPLGKDTGPSPVRILAAAVGNCLAASLVFCAAKRGVQIKSMRASVRAEIVRNENKRLRVGRMEVEIDPGLEAESIEKMKACLPAFEDFCTVTASVRQGIDIVTRVKGL